MSFLKKTLNLYLSSLDLMVVTAEVAREPTLNFLELFLNDDFALDEPFSIFIFWLCKIEVVKCIFLFFKYAIRREFFGL